MVAGIIQGHIIEGKRHQVIDKYSAGFDGSIVTHSDIMNFMKAALQAEKERNVKIYIGGDGDDGRFQSDGLELASVIYMMPFPNLSVDVEGPEAKKIATELTGILKGNAINRVADKSSIQL